jgi:hypothetical protein
MQIPVLNISVARKEIKLKKTSIFYNKMFSIKVAYPADVGLI